MRPPEPKTTTLSADRFEEIYRSVVGKCSPDVKEEEDQPGSSRLQEEMKEGDSNRKILVQPHDEDIQYEDNMDEEYIYDQPERRRPQVVVSGLLWFR